MRQPKLDWTKEEDIRALAVSELNKKANKEKIKKLSIMDEELNTKFMKIDQILIDLQVRMNQAEEQLKKLLPKMKKIRKTKRRKK